MSRFFATRASDDESDSSSSSSAAGMGGQMQMRDQQQQSAMLLYDSSSSEEEKRVVRSARDKQSEAMTATIRALRNSMKIDDWANVLKAFEAANRLIEKARPKTQKEGIPRQYIRMLCDLEDAVNAAVSDRDARKQLSGPNSRAVNVLKQKMRKHNRQFEALINEYRASPDQGGDQFASSASDEETGSSSEDASEEERSEGESEGEPGSDDQDDDKAFDDDDDEFDFESDDDASASSASSDSDIDLSHPAMSRAYWVKKTKDDEEEMTKEDRRRLRQKKASTTGGTKASRALAKAGATAEAAKEIEFTPELIQQKLMLIQSSRGKRGADRHAAVKELKVLASKASSVPALIKVKITLLSAMFDINFNSGTHMQVSLWHHACDTLLDILDTLDDNPNVLLIEDADVDETVFAVDANDKEAVARAESITAMQASATATALSVVEAGGAFIPEVRHKRDDGLEYVAGNVYSFAARLSDEYVASLQNLDPHTQEYLDRLGDEPRLLQLLGRAHDYYGRARVGDQHRRTCTALLALLRVELLYTKYEPALDAHRDGGEGDAVRSRARLIDDVLHGDPRLLLHRLCALLYAYGDARGKARAVLCTAYHHAMHGEFHAARDLILMSHVHDTIGQADVSTQILYNRALAMLSVCAFRQGLMGDALSLIADLYGTGRIRELLAQGTGQTRWGQDRDTEQEKLERRRQMPYHVHLSLDLLESVHLVSAMILEVPNLAVHAADDKRHVISKNFRRVWDAFHKNAFNGPPENTRDYVIAAAVALSDGDWRAAYDHLLQLKCWALIPHAAKAQAVLRAQVQVTGLQTWLLAYGAHYVSLDARALADRFDLAERDVRACASRLIAADRLAGAWDEPANAIGMAAPIQNDLQSAALKFADIVGILVEQNERSLEHRHQHGKGGGGGGGGGPFAASSTGGAHHLKRAAPAGKPQQGEFGASRRW